MTVASVDTALSLAARGNGLSLDNATLLRHHAAAVYLLPAEGIVARISRGEDAARASRAVSVARWFADHGVPVAVPAALDQPFAHEDRVITFWTYYPQNDRQPPPAASLGSILRELHAAPAPPIKLPRYEPLSDLGVALAGASTLETADRQWLIDERARLLDEYACLDFSLEPGHIHGDAYPGNLLWDGDAVLLGDWDEVAWGPRELDLANTYQGVRFGRSESELEAFADAYGYDLSGWPGLETLTAIRDLHTLAAFIRRAEAGSEKARRQLSMRIATLRRRDTRARWDAN